MNFTLFEISWNGYIKFKFFAGKKFSFAIKIYQQDFSGIKTPSISSNRQKTAFYQQTAVGQAPDSHYWIIKRINPLILSRDLNSTDLWIWSISQNNENQKKPNHEQAVWKSHETLVKRIFHQFFIVIWVRKANFFSQCDALRNIS